MSPSRSSSWPRTWSPSISASSDQPSAAREVEHPGGGEPADLGGRLVGRVTDQDEQLPLLVEVGGRDGGDHRRGQARRRRVGRATTCPGGRPGGGCHPRSSSLASFVRAVRTLARQRARVGPMLPTGMSRSWLSDVVVGSVHEGDDAQQLAAPFVDGRHGSPQPRRLVVEHRHRLRRHRRREARQPAPRPPPASARRAALACAAAPRLAEVISQDATACGSSMVWWRRTKPNHVD